VEGDKDRALRQPFTVLLTASTARKFFGEENPIGKRITYDSGREFTVTGILRDIPSASHFHPDFVASITSLPAIMWPTALEGYFNSAFKTYVLLKEGASADALDAKIHEFIPTQVSAQKNEFLQLQPLLDIHLHSNLAGEVEPNSDIQYVYALLAIAFIILMIASINYTNMAIAHSTVRGKEVGVRKVHGASRSNLIAQFIGESFVIVLASFLVGLGFAEFVLPYVDQLTGKQLSMASLTSGWNIISVLSFILLLSVIAGWYPALYISRLKPISAFKGVSDTQRVRTRIRQALVIAQFSAGISLVIGALVVYHQLEYMKTMKLGFSKEQVVVLPVKDAGVSRDPEAIRTELLRHPEVEDVSWANAMPGIVHAGDRMRWEGSASNQFLPTSVNWGDEHFLPTLKISLVTGRNFAKGPDFGKDAPAIVNESAVRFMGWKSPEEALGKTLFGGGTSQGVHRIIGVMKDFHFESLRHEISPLVVLPQASAAYLLIRVKTGDLPRTLSDLKRSWGMFTAAQPFTFSVLDQDFEALF
jgi:putative ABC transport system permease protein